MEDPRNTFLESLDILRMRVEHRPVKLFFCGGPVEDVSKPIISVRDYVIRHIWESSPALGDDIVLAEEIKDWLNYATYEDLITFEQHLAHLASVIVLVVESPGSIAKLGAFSFAWVEQIASKLIVFVREDHYNRESYIRLGPLKYIETIYDAARVSVYPWREFASIEGHDCRSKLDSASVSTYIADIADDTTEFLKELPKSEKFNTNNEGHQMLLISDLLDLFLILKEGEILRFLATLGIDLDVSRLRQYLFICEKLNLLVQHKYSGSPYCVRRNARSLIKYATKDVEKLSDRLKIKSQIRLYYEKHDPKRFRALRKFRETE